MTPHGWGTRGMRRSAGPLARVLLGAIGAWAVPAPFALAQEPHPLRAENTPVEHPDVAEPVLKRIEAPYLTAEERKNLRVFHGVWQEGDLDTPQRRASAALIRGAYDDPSLQDPG